MLRIGLIIAILVAAVDILYVASVSGQGASDGRRERQKPVDCHYHRYTRGSREVLQVADANDRSLVSGEVNANYAITYSIIPINCVVKSTGPIPPNADPIARIFCEIAEAMKRSWREAILQAISTTDDA